MSLLPKHLSLRLVTVVAALETFALRLYANEASEAIANDANRLRLSSLALSFGLFWVATLFVYGLYFTFIYPFYVSPTRHLPTVGGRHWLMGHIPQLFSAAPGESSRTW